MTLARRYADSPPEVLVVSDAGADDPVVEAVSTASGEYGVSVVDDGRAARSAVDDATWCVVARSPLPGGTAAFVETVTTEHPWLPVVVAGKDDDGVAREVVAAGGRFLPIEEASDADEPGEAGAEPIRATVEAALAEGERRRSDAAYRSLLQEFFEGCDDMGFVKDASGRYVYASDYSGGPDPETILGRTDAALAREDDSAWDDRHRRHELTMSVLESNAPLRQRVEQYGEDESAFWFSHTIVPWRDDDGRAKGVVGQTREVSERKRRERALERQVDRLEQFTNFVSHDLRSPLQLMQGYLELAREGDEAAFDHLEAASRRMGELIEDLEALAADEDTTIELDRSVDLVAVARQVWSFLSTDDASLEVELPGSTTLSGAESELRPMLENLFKNALVHGGAGVTVRLGALDDGFFVEDDGPGIPEEARDEVFAEGYTTSEDGTGTGLAIVTDVVGAHGWEIEVTDGRDGGARFEVHNCMMATRPDVAYEPGAPHEIEASTDVGAVKTAGSAVEDPATGTWTVRGAGDDLFQDANDFHFAYATATGPVRIQARIPEIEPVNPFSKAGVMVRGGSDDDAPHGYLGRTVDRGPEVSWRYDAGARSETQQLRARTERATWVRLDREDEQLTCSISEDGQGWEVVDQRTVALSGPVCVGLVVCSVVPRALCTATFEDVSIRELRPREG